MKKFKSYEANFAICLFAGSALIYEVILASSVVQLFGDSIFYFSITIALFILFMGLGSSSMSRFKKNYLVILLYSEIVISVCGALGSAVILLTAGATKSGLLTCLIALIFTAIIGFLAGLEIPLVYALTDRMDRQDGRFSIILVFDYLGALLGALLFSFFLMPLFDLVGTSGILGMVNVVFLSFLFYKYKIYFPQTKIIGFFIILSFLVCGAVFIFRHLIQQEIDQKIFQISLQTQITNSFRTKYQKVTVTLTPAKDIENKYQYKYIKQNESSLEVGAPWISIYLNSYVQAFSPLGSETDIYHHAFVHPAMVLAKKRDNVLILGGGDGLPAKEVEKYEDVKNIINVDLDGEWVQFSKTNPLMKKHNLDSLSNPKLHLIVSDAFRWVRDTHQKFDVILVDFPEGIDLPLARSYSLQFLRDLKRLINDEGIISFQVDFFNNQAYWCVVKTMVEAGYQIIPHRALDPGYDNYGLILLSKKRLSLDHFDQKLKSYSFIDPNLILSQAVLESYRNEDAIKAQTQGLMLNTFFHPSFLYYYRVTFPWDLFIGNND